MDFQPFMPFDPLKVELLKVKENLKKKEKKTAISKK